MPTALVSSSVSAFTETTGTTVTTPVPTGTAAGHIALLAFELWDAAATTVTWPTGFTQVVNVTAGSSQKLLVAWKRLTAADTGSYVATLSTSQAWTAHCLLVSGGLASGNPIEATNTATAVVATAAIPSTSVTTATQAFLAHLVAPEVSQAAASSVPPTGYTMAQQGRDLISNYRIPGTTGSQTASGGTLATASIMAVALVAVMPAAAGVTGTLAGTLPALIGSVTAAAKVSGTTAGTLPALTGSITAAAKVTGTSAGTLPAITGTLTGSVGAAGNVTSTLAGTLPALTGSATATVRVSGTASPTLIDDFNDNVIDPVRWPGSFGARAEVGGRARVDCTTAFGGYGSAQIYTMTEATVQARMYPAAAGGTAGEAWAQLAVKSTTGGTDLLMEVNAATGQLRMATRSGSFDGAVVLVPYDPVAHAWLRIREAAGTTYWETSSDGATWTTRRTAVSPTWATATTLKIELTAHRDAGTADFAEFDDFAFTRTTGTLPSLTGAMTGALPTSVSAALAGVLPALTGSLNVVLGGLSDLTLTIGPTRSAPSAGRTRAGLTTGSTRSGTTVRTTRRDRG